MEVFEVIFTDFGLKFVTHRHDFKFVDCARPLVCKCGKELNREKGEPYEET